MITLAAKVIRANGVTDEQIVQAIELWCSDYMANLYSVNGNTIENFMVKQVGKFRIFKSHIQFTFGSKKATVLIQDKNANLRTVFRSILEELTRKVEPLLPKHK